MIPTSTTAPARGGFSELVDWGVLKVSGDDAGHFLQGQATTDVLALASGTLGCGALCTPKGRVLANFRIARADDGYRLLLAAELAEPLRERLQRYVLRARVTLENLTGPARVWGFFGGNTSLPAGLGWPLSDGSDRHLAILAADQSPPGEPLPADAWRLADIEAGFARILPATGEEFLPQMLNLDRMGGIGFSKGCYTGQEIVTRTHYLGQLKRRLFRFRVEGGECPPPGAPILDTSGDEPRSAGQVVNACPAPAGGSIGLAVIALEFAGQPGLRLADAEGAPVRLEPLVDDDRP